MPRSRTRPVISSTSHTTSWDISTELTKITTQTIPVPTKYQLSSFSISSRLATARAILTIAMNIRIAANILAVE